MISLGQPGWRCTDKVVKRAWKKSNRTAKGGILIPWWEGLDTTKWTQTERVRRLCPVRFVSRLLYEEARCWKRTETMIVRRCKETLHRLWKVRLRGRMMLKPFERSLDLSHIWLELVEQAIGAKYTDGIDQAITNIWPTHCVDNRKLDF